MPLLMDVDQTLVWVPLEKPNYHGILHLFELRNVKVMLGAYLPVKVVRLHSVVILLPKDVLHNLIVVRLHPVVNFGVIDYDFWKLELYLEVFDARLEVFICLAVEQALALLLVKLLSFLSISVCLDNPVVIIEPDKLLAKLRPFLVIIITFPTEIIGSFMMIMVDPVTKIRVIIGYCYKFRLYVFI